MTNEARLEHALEPIRIHPDEPVPLAQGTDFVPHGGNDRMEVAHLQIAEPDMDNARRRRVEHHAGGKVGIFGDDAQAMTLGVRPNPAITLSIAQVIPMKVIRTRPERKAVRQIGVDQVFGHAKPKALGDALEGIGMTHQLSGKAQARVDVFGLEARVLPQNLLAALTRGQKLEHRLHGDPLAPNGRLAVQEVGVDGDPAGELVGCFAHWLSPDSHCSSHTDPRAVGSAAATPWRQGSRPRRTGDGYGLGRTFGSRSIPMTRPKSKGRRDE